LAIGTMRSGVASEAGSAMRWVTVSAMGCRESVGTVKVPDRAFPVERENTRGGALARVAGAQCPLPFPVSQGYTWIISHPSRELS